MLGCNSLQPISSGSVTRTEAPVLRLDAGAMIDFPVGEEARSVM